MLQRHNFHRAMNVYTCSIVEEVLVSLYRTIDIVMIKTIRQGVALQGRNDMQRIISRDLYRSVSEPNTYCFHCC